MSTAPINLVLTGRSCGKMLALEQTIALVAVFRTLGWV